MVSEESLKFTSCRKIISFNILSPSLQTPVCLFKAENHSQQQGIYTQQSCSSKGIEWFRAKPKEIPKAQSTLQDANTPMGRGREDGNLNGKIYNLEQSMPEKLLCPCLGEGNQPPAGSWALGLPTSCPSQGLNNIVFT